MPDTLSLRALNRATLARQLLLEPSSLSPRVALERVGGPAGSVAKAPVYGAMDSARQFQTRRSVRAAAPPPCGTRDDDARHHPRGDVEGLSRDARRDPARADARRLAGQGARRQARLEAVLAAARKLFDAPHTFEEVRDALVAQFPEGNDRALGHVARMMLPLVMVPTDDPWPFPSVAEFQLAESWLGKPIPEATDPSELVLRYFAAFGPASVADVQSWSGLQALRAVVEKLRPKLRTFRDPRGRELFDLPDALRPDEDTPAPMRFLPEFDNVLLGYQDRARIMADAHKPYVFLAGLRVTSTVIVDGLVVATWRMDRTKKQSTIGVQLLEKLPKRTVAEIEKEAERVVKFMEPEAAAHDVRWPK